MSDRYSRLSGLGGLRERVARMPAWGQWLLVAALLLVLSTWLTVRFVYTHTPLSPIDEYNYVDAVDKASRGIVVREGDMADQMARQAVSCRGIGFEDAQVEVYGRCGVDEPDEVYPWDGRTSAAIHSPVYYFTTAWLAKAITWLAPVGLITAARLTGALWLGLGALVLCYLLRRTGMGWGVSLPVTVAVISMPAFRATNAYISPDALNLLAGSAVFLAALLYARREWGILPLVVISAAVTLVKFQNSFAVMAVLVFLLWYRVASTRSEGGTGAAGPKDDLVVPAARDALAPGTSRWLSAASGTGGSRDGAGGLLGPLTSWLVLLLPPVAAVGAGMAWMRVQRAIGNPVAGIRSDPEGSPSLTGSLFNMDDTVQSIFSGNWAQKEAGYSVFPTLATWFCVAALCALAWFLPRISQGRRSFVQAGIVSLLGAGPAVNLSFAIVFGSEVAMQPRYGMVLVPLLVLPAAWMITRRPLRIGLTVFAVAAYLYAFLTLRIA